MEWLRVLLIYLTVLSIFLGLTIGLDFDEYGDLCLMLCVIWPVVVVMLPFLVLGYIFMKIGQKIRNKIVKEVL